MEDDKQCMLVIIGALSEGKKELLGFLDGYRESTQSWRKLLLDLKARGLTVPPKLAIGEGALEEVWSQARNRRCWIQKKPKSIQGKIKHGVHNIWMAETKEDASKDFDLFLDKYGVKYQQAPDCLKKDRQELVTFYDFPAEHWKNIRTTNPIESTFGIVRHRPLKGACPRKQRLSWYLNLSRQPR